MKNNIKFKIRCSAIGQIMTDGSGVITEKQLETIKVLSGKEKKTKLQEEKLKELIYKRDNPELSATAKTYCKEWLIENYFGRRKEISNKYTEKGIEVEDESIEFLVDNNFLFAAEKNTERKTNEYMTGECDINQPKEIWDVKNVWSMFTFPIFETENKNKAYEWQAQGYMELYDKNDYKLAYILSNTPQYLIDKEIGYAFRDTEFLTENDYNKAVDKIMKNHIFDDIDPQNRVKIFEFKRDKQAIEKVKERVKACQNYIDSLILKFIK